MSIEFDSWPEQILADSDSSRGKLIAALDESNLRPKTFYYLKDAVVLPSIHVASPAPTVARSHIKWDSGTGIRGMVAPLGRSDLTLDNFRQACFYGSYCELNPTSN